MRGILSFWCVEIMLVTAAPLMAEARAPWADHAPWPDHARWADPGPRAGVAPWRDHAAWGFYDGRHPDYFYQGNEVTGEFENGQPVCTGNGRHGHHKRAEEEQAACEAAQQQWIRDHSRRAFIYHR